MADRNIFREFLAAVHPAVLEFDTAALLSGRITDYEHPVIKDHYALAAVAKEVRPAGADDDAKMLRRSRYVLAFDRNTKRMPFKRFATYLFNRFGWAERQCPAGFDIGEINVRTMASDSYRHRGGGSACTVGCIDEMFSLADPERPSTADFDIRLILDLIDERNNGEYIFKNTGGYPGIYGSIASPNSYGNPIFRRRGELGQQHERELAERMLNHRNYAGTLTDAVVDLALDRRGTNMAVLTENPMTALYMTCSVGNDFGGCITVLKRSALDVRREVAYPVEQDFILHPDAVNSDSPAIKAQSAVFLYCRKAWIEQYGCDDSSRNICIPEEAIPLLRQYSGLEEHEVYPDVRSLLNEPWNLESSAAMER